MAITIRDIYDEFTGFITSTPPLEAIADYHLSETAEEYINSLLEANESRRLTAEEQAELDDFMTLEHVMRMIKFRAIEKLEQAKV